MKVGPLTIPRRRFTRLAVPFFSLVVLTALLAPRTPFASRPAMPAEAAALAGGGAPVTLYAWFDLPKSDARSAELSGVTWDNAQRTLYAITDDAPRIIPLTPSPDYRTWTFGDPIAVQVSGDWDGEGIVLTPEGFFISNEFGPAIVHLDRDGRVVAEVPVPAHFQRILRNRGFEALTLSPDGRYLFTANESPLEGDGPQPTAEQGGLVRILRHDLSGGQQTEYAYRTDPIFAPGEGGDRGVVDMIALSGTDLLVMERSFVPDVGNNVRIHRVSLAGGQNVLTVENLSEATPTLTKTMLVDLADLPDDTFPEPRQPQPNRILDNFEGLALGPALPDGRRLLFVISDDNKRDTQTPRILVLAVAGL
jgi:hypothetical protein